MAAKLHAGCTAALEAFSGHRRVADLIAAYTALADWWRQLSAGWRRSIRGGFWPRPYVFTRSMLIWL
ncbi:MAG: hypothetical protein ACUVRC_09580 [Desulfotomaculales bacterium]